MLYTNHALLCKIKKLVIAFLQEGSIKLKVTAVQTCSLPIAM